MFENLHELYVDVTDLKVSGFMTPDQVLSVLVCALFFSGNTTSNQIDIKFRANICLRTVTQTTIILAFSDVYATIWKHSNPGHWGTKI